MMKSPVILLIFLCGIFRYMGYEKWFVAIIFILPFVDMCCRLSENPLNNGDVPERYQEFMTEIATSGRYRN
jgi:hypothetical protein